MASKKLAKVIKKLREIEEQEGQVDYAAVSKEWEEDLDSLMQKIDMWLSDFVKNGLVEIFKETVSISEKGLGEYFAPVRKIRLPDSRVITVIPVGRIVLGAGGRVDLDSGPMKAVLLRFGPGDWRVQVKPGGSRKATYEILTEDSFSDIIEELIS